MDVMETFDRVTSWDGPFEKDDMQRAIVALESGKVLYFPSLRFVLNPDESVFLTPSCTDGKSKNISYDPGEDAVRGTAVDGPEQKRMTAMMRRYGDTAQELLLGLIPGYRTGLERARTSFRPVEIKGRASSGRKDDTRLHVDAFPSRPNQGRRIMRVFTNVNPHGQPRVWHLGEPFDIYAQHFLPAVRPALPGSARLLHWLHITRSLRTPYDHIMLNLHDRGKLDKQYQDTAPKTRIEFPSGSTWIVFTDQVLHAALEGQYVFEQTFQLDVESLARPEQAPLHRLEYLTGRTLV